MHTLTTTPAQHTPWHWAQAQLARWLSGADRARTRVQHLDSTQVARIAHPQQRRITCLTGTLWLTFDGQPEDTVLEAGQSLVCPHPGALLISAFGQASWRAE